MPLSTTPPTLCISRPVQNHSGFYYYALSLSLLWGYEERNERLCFYCWSVNSVSERTQYHSSRFLQNHYLHCEINNRRQHFYSDFKWWRNYSHYSTPGYARASQKKHMIIIGVVPSSTRGRSKVEPRGTVVTFVYALPDKNSVRAETGIKCLVEFPGEIK